MAFTATIRSVGAVSVIDLSGRLTLGEGTSMIRDSVKLALHQSSKILLNMAQVSYIDSAGLGELTSGYASAASRGAQIKLVGLQDKVISLLQITKLHTLFEIFDQEAAAIASFEGLKANA